MPKTKLPPLPEINLEDVFDNPNMQIICYVIEVLDKKTGKTYYMYPDDNHFELLGWLAVTKKVFFDYAASAYRGDKVRD